MAIINDMLEDNIRNEVVESSSQDNTLSNIVRLVEAIERILNNPAILSRFGKNIVGNNTIQNNTIQNNTEQSNQKNLDYKNFIIEFLKRPDAKDEIKKFIQDLINYVGDIKLSQLLEAIDKLNFGVISSALSKRSEDDGNKLKK